MGDHHVPVSSSSTTAVEALLLRFATRNSFSVDVIHKAGHCNNDKQTQPLLLIIPSFSSSLVLGLYA